MSDTPKELVERRCTCAEVEGEDPDCVHHGVETEWALTGLLPEDWQNIVTSDRLGKASLRAEITRLTTATADLEEQVRLLTKEVRDGEAEVADLERQLAEARAAFLETREFLGLLEQGVCDWSCPSKWRTDEGQPHSKLHADLQNVLAKHEPVRDAARRTLERTDHD